MTLFNLHQKETLIYPGEKDQVSFWTKKWGITREQLNEAILQTGSLNTKQIKNYLINRGFIFSFSGLMNNVKHLPIKMINYFL